MTEKVQKRSGILKGVTLNVILLGFVSLFTDLSSQMVFPLLPLFLTTSIAFGGLGTSAVVGLVEGASESTEIFPKCFCNFIYVVGLVEGASESTASLLKVLSGYWSDRIHRRKPFVLGGYSLSAIIKPLFSFASIWQIVVALRVFERIGKGVRNAPRDAIVAESCDDDCRGKAYGIQRSMDGIGSVLGALLAFLLFPLFGFRRVFLLAAIPAFIAVVFILFVKENKSKFKLPKEESEKTGLYLSFKRLPKNLRFFILVATIFTFGNIGYAFLLLRSIDLGLEADIVLSFYNLFGIVPFSHEEPILRLSMALLLYAFFYVIYTIFSIPSGMISDKIGRRPVLILGYSLFGLLCIGLTLSSTLLEISIMFAVFGIFYALTDGVQRAFVVDLSPPDLRATSLGAFHTAVGISALPAGIIAGTLWDKIGPEATFLFGFVMSLLAVFLFLFLKEK